MAEAHSDPSQAFSKWSFDRFSEKPNNANCLKTLKTIFSLCLNISQYFAKFRWFATWMLLCFYRTRLANLERAITVNIEVKPLI